MWHHHLLRDIQACTDLPGNYHILSMLRCAWVVSWSWLVCAHKVLNIYTHYWYSTDTHSLACELASECCLCSTRCAFRSRILVVIQPLQLCNRYRYAQKIDIIQASLLPCSVPFYHLTTIQDLAYICAQHGSITHTSTMSLPSTPPIKSLLHLLPGDQGEHTSQHPAPATRAHCMS